jgi:hypothetical protein
MTIRLLLAGLLLVTAAPAWPEGALPAPGTAATAILLGAQADGDHAGGGAFVFRNPGTASQRLLLAGRDPAVECTPDGSSTSRSRPGQFTIAGGAELHCTAEPGTHRFSTIGSEGGAIREHKGKLVVR